MFSNNAFIINGHQGLNSLKDSLRAPDRLEGLIFSFSFCPVLNSKLPYDVTPEQAMSHEEVRTRLEASIKNMKAITDKFLSAIIVSVDKIPYVAHSQSRCLRGRAGCLFPLSNPRTSLTVCQIRDAFHLQGAEGHPPREVPRRYRGRVAQGLYL